MKFIKLTEHLGKYFNLYEKSYGRGALEAYLKGYVRGLERLDKKEQELKAVEEEFNIPVSDCPSWT
jgi:hypothetical protein